MNESADSRRRFPPAAIAGIILLIICGISLYLRIGPVYDHTFVDGAVWFRGTDAYYFMRHIENMVYNFPHIISFDPYKLYPGGSAGPSYPFFVWFVAAIARIVGQGSPSPHTIQVVGAYVPPIMGTLTVVTVYFIGKELFNRWVGALSAVLLAILPGEFLNRSLLGTCDHHVVDSFLSTLSILFFILAIKKARERQLSFSHILKAHHAPSSKEDAQQEKAKITVPLIYSSLAGLLLGFHLLCWKGALMLIFIIFAYLVIQSIIEHLRGKSGDYLWFIGTPYFLIALIIFLLYRGIGGASSVHGISLLAGALTPIILSIILRQMSRKAIKLAYHLPIVIGLAAITLVIFRVTSPSLFHSMLSEFSAFAPSGAHLTILEMHPLLFPYGEFTLEVAWLNFTTAFFIAFISLGLLIYICIKEGGADKTLLVIWSLVTLIAALAQRRFGDCFSITAALLTGYLAWRILDFAGLEKLFAVPRQIVKAYTGVKDKKARKKAKAIMKPGESTFMQPRDAWLKVIIAGVIIFFLVFFPNISKAKALASGPSLIDQAWYSSLEWLRDNSPEPFPDPDFYHEIYETPFEYPETTYGVMSWWDYGYWIMHISHRIPNSNPGQQNVVEVARFFTDQDEDSANQIADKLGCKYLVIDYQMPTTKFYAMPRWLGSSKDEYYGTYYQVTEDAQLQPITLFYPTYYQSMVVRLYNFDGKASSPQDSVAVISYEEKASREGVPYMEITSSTSFATYEEAESFISQQESSNFRIVSPDPFGSPVPLAELEHYKLVHASSQKWYDTPAVKIFEYTD